MEESSLSGINLATLKEDWEDFLKLPFPRPPKDERLAAIYPDIVLLDGHVAGIVSSFLNGRKIDRRLIYVDEDLNAKLASIKAHDSVEKNDEWLLLRQRKDRLDRFVEEVLSLYDKTG